MANIFMSPEENWTNLAIISGIQKKNEQVLQTFPVLRLKPNKFDKHFWVLEQNWATLVNMSSIYCKKKYKKNNTDKTFHIFETKHKCIHNIPKTKTKDRFILDEDVFIAIWHQNKHSWIYYCIVLINYRLFNCCYISYFH